MVIAKDIWQNLGFIEHISRLIQASNWHIAGTNYQEVD
jgi:hypothetical protein